MGNTVVEIDDEWVMSVRKDHTVSSGLSMVSLTVKPFAISSPPLAPTFDIYHFTFVKDDHVRVITGDQAHRFLLAPRLHLSD